MWYNRSMNEPGSAEVASVNPRPVPESHEAIPQVVSNETLQQVDRESQPTNQKTPALLAARQRLLMEQQEAGNPDGDTVTEALTHGEKKPGVIMRMLKKILQFLGLYRKQYI